MIWLNLKADWRLSFITLPLPVQSCHSSIFVKENTDRKKRYRFTLKASSFGLFSRNSSVTSVKISVCLLQQVECAGSYKFINLSIFFTTKCPFPIERMARYCRFFGPIAVFSDLLGITCCSSTGKLPYLTNGNTCRSLFYNFKLSTAIFANGKCVKYLLQQIIRNDCERSLCLVSVSGSFSESLFSEDRSRLLSLLSSEIHFTFWSNYPDSSKSLHQTFLRAFFSRYQNEMFVTLLTAAAFHFLPIVNF